jgi:hypothetical protein
MIIEELYYRFLNSLSYVIFIPMKLAIADAPSAMMKDHQILFTSPVRERRYAAGSRTII